MHLRFNYRFKSRKSGIISLKVGLYLLTSRNQVDDKPRYNDMPITPNLLKDFEPGSETKLDDGSGGVSGSGKRAP